MRTLVVAIGQEGLCLINRVNHCTIFHGWTSPNRSFSIVYHYLRRNTFSHTCVRKSTKVTRPFCHIFWSYHSLAYNDSVTLTNIYEYHITEKERCNGKQEGVNNA